MSSVKRIKKKNTFPLRTAVISLLIVLVVFLAGVAFLPLKKGKGVINNQTIQKSAPIEALAEQIVASCKSEIDPHKCYEENVPDLMDTISMADAFRVVQLIQEKDQSYKYCHTLGHALSAREVQKDPSKWKEVVTQCPSGVCSNGCIHGGFQEKFRNLDVLSNLSEKEQKQVIENLKTVCEARKGWVPTGMEQASCYHALGHLTMYITFADAKESTDICDVIAQKSDGRDFRQVCYDGVFMQINQPLEDEDFALIKGKELTKDSLVPFCNHFSGDKRGSCISEAWPLFREDLLNPSGATAFCEMEIGTAQKDRCYIALIWVMTPQFEFNTERISKYCEGYPSERQARCYADVAGRLLENDFRNVDRAVTFCQQIKETKNKERCLDELVFYAGYNFPKGSDDARRLCTEMTEPWKSKCLAKL